ncbi:type II toxin-antitoxin system VapC family toxin [Micropruina sp.]|uniref:type II toxin-antitoxin system VapC family toxin n=1 Tax=Micropruina sp. TaxID=2737536 RepID=UPI0039E22F78
MTYLLDTHTLLWALTAPSRLGAEAARVIADRRSQVVASAASAWEIATKHRIGKLPQADAVIGGYARHLDRLGAVRLPLTEEHCLLSGNLDWAHRDPFDRMLAAQAMIESMTLITDDAAFRGLPGLRTLW